MVSLVSASFTVMLHRLSSRLAKARVNSSGICCTITMPGVSAGRVSSRVFNASVPPVDAPITTTFSVVSAMAWVAGERMASAVNLGSTVWLGRRMRSLVAAAALTAWQRVMRASSRNCLVPSRGLVTISTAPYSRALKVLCAPSSARLEQITTGMGCWLMIFFRKVSPSMRGISISSVITSGTCSAMRSAATKGSLAVPITSISGSDESTSHSVCRTTAESSTISTRIFGEFTTSASLFVSALSVMTLMPRARSQRAGFP